MRPISASVRHRSVASVESVWAVVTDVEGLGRFSNEYERAEWLRGATTLAIGSQFRGFNRWGLLRWSTVCQIVEFSAPYRLAFDARHWSGVVTRWAFTVQRDGEHTVITEGFQTGRGPALVLMIDRLLGRPRRLRRGMELTVAGVAGAAERAEAG